MPPRAADVLSLPSYVTGGGGGDVQSLGAPAPRTTRTRSAGPTRAARGRKCGTAPVPTSRTPDLPLPQGHGLGLVRHRHPDRLHGPHVRRPDLQLHAAARHLHRQRAAGRHHQQQSPPSRSTPARTTATFTCKLDSAAAKACTSPTIYTGLAPGPAHLLRVRHDRQGQRPAPRHLDVDRRHHAADDAGRLRRLGDVAVLGVAALERGDRQHRRHGLRHRPRRRDRSRRCTPSTSYTDTAVVGSTTHTYAVRARDIAGNMSAPTTDDPRSRHRRRRVPVFADGFESGNLSAWTIDRRADSPRRPSCTAGPRPPRATPSTARPTRKKTLPATYPNAFARVYVQRGLPGRPGEPAAHARRRRRTRSATST